MLWLHNVSRKLWNVLITKRVCHDFLHCTYFQHCERIVYLLQGRVLHEYVYSVTYTTISLCYYRITVQSWLTELKWEEYINVAPMTLLQHNDTMTMTRQWLINDPQMTRQWPLKGSTISTVIWQWPLFGFANCTVEIGGVSLPHLAFHISYFKHENDIWWCFIIIVALFLIFHTLF